MATFYPRGFCGQQRLRQRPSCSVELKRRIAEEIDALVKIILIRININYYSICDILYRMSDVTLNK